MAQHAAFIQGKVVFVGDASVGKTSIINKFRRVGGTPASTVAAQTINLTVSVHGAAVPLTVYDTAGQDDYRCLVPLYVRGAQIAIIVYSQASAQTFAHVPDWVAYLRNTSAVPHVVLVANKADLGSALPLPSAEEELAAREGMHFVRTSAVTGQNVDELFAMVAEFVQADSAAVESRIVAGGPQARARGDCACAAA
jgi:small GTP-binding protein